MLYKVAYVLLRDSEYIYLQLRDDKPGIFSPGKVGFFGGGIENDEGLLEAAAREVSEETNLDFNIQDLKQIYKFSSEYSLLSDKGYDMHEGVVFELVIDDDTDLKVFEGQGYEKILIKNPRFDDVNIHSFTHMVLDDYLEVNGGRYEEE